MLQGDHRISAFFPTYARILW